MKHAATGMVLCAGALLCLGMVALFSASVEFSLRSPVGFQLVWCGLGLVAATVAAAADYRWLRKLSWPLYLLALGLLVAVLLVGKKMYGATRWLEPAPGVSFQPSEFAKLAVVVMLAFYCEKYHRRIPTVLGGLVIPGVLVGAVLGLVFKEPDWGTTLLLGSVAGVMLVVAGVRWAHLLPVALVAGLVLGAALLQDPVRLERVRSWLNPDLTREAAGMQSYQAKLALGSGGLTGAGLGSGEHYGYIPFVDSDFIFAILGEELGLVCTLGVVLAFSGLVVCGVVIAWRARDVFGLLLATGLTFLIGLQAFINMGVVTSLLPNKGLPLPFVSKGGSSLFMVLVFVGLLLSIARTTAREVVRETPEPELEDEPATQLT